jgi:hypothetical protein
MTISMYSASVPVFKQLLSALNDILVKGASAVNDKMNPDTLLHARLFPDMFDFTRQVQIATDFAKGVTARLADQEVPVYEDNETTLHFISSIPAEKIDGSETRDIITRPGTPKEKKFNGQSYLLHYGLPQFFFHITTAYAILRSHGIEIGKRDYMGTF